MSFKQINKHVWLIVVTFGVGLCIAIGCQTGVDDALPSGDPVPGEQGEAGASPFSLVGDDAVYTKGNVGVGTETPVEALHVVGNARADGTVFADAFSSNSPLRLQTAGTTRVYVDDTTGRVGMGTDTPEADLHIKNEHATAIGTRKNKWQSLEE